MVKAVRQHSSRTDGKKSLSVVDYNGHKCVMKVYSSERVPHEEAAVMRQLGITGYAPTVVEAEGNYIIAEYVEGEDYATLFRRATMTDDEQLLDTLATRLCMFLQMFYSLEEGHIIGRIDFDEFILSHDRCCCVCFSSMREGLPYQDIAQIVAYAMCAAVGGCYAAYPFVKKVLDGFHIDMTGIVNDMGEYIDAYAEETGALIDKNAILEAAMSLADGDVMKKWQTTD